MNDSKPTTELRSNSVRETLAIARRLGEMLPGGSFVALCGPLGAGKTHFAKGLAAGLGVPEDEPIVSPTFVLVREYHGRMPVLHADLYRLGNAEEWNGLGLEEARATGTVLLVEWADRFPEIVPDDAVWVELGYCDLCDEGGTPNPDARDLRIKSPAVLDFGAASRRP